MDIGLIGYSRTGKDSIAAHLVANHGYRRIAFADPLKALARLADPVVDTDTGLSRSLVEMLATYGEDGTKDRTPEYIRFLERLGAGVREVLGEGVWLNKALDDVRAARTAGCPVVITDVRYPNEATALRYLGFKMVRVTRPGVGPQSDHPSATLLENCAVDTTVHNAGSLEDLQHMTDYLVFPQRYVVGA